MHFVEYQAILKVWRIKYKVQANPPPPKKATFNLASKSIDCFRCRKPKFPLHRHHTGNDFFFARLLPDSYARRYLEFHPDDVELLCENCHKKIHEISNGLLNIAKFELAEEGVKIVTEEWCEDWKAQIRALFYDSCKRTQRNAAKYKRHAARRNRKRL